MSTVRLFPIRNVRRVEFHDIDLHSEGDRAGLAFRQLTITKADGSAVEILLSSEQAESLMPIFTDPPFAETEFDEPIDFAIVAPTPLESDIPLILPETHDLGACHV